MSVFLRLESQDESSNRSLCLLSSLFPYSCFLRTSLSANFELGCSPYSENNNNKKTGKSDHIIPLFQSLHWLPVSHRMQYKLNTPCYNCLSRSAPPYFCYCLQLYAPFRTLRSAPDTISAFGSLVADFPLLVLLPFPSLDLYQE